MTNLTRTQSQTGAAARPIWVERWLQRQAMTLHFLKRNPLAVVGLVILGTILLGALLAPVIAPHDPTKVSVKEMLDPPSAAHPFGTDFLGRDLFSRILHGGRNTLAIGLAVVTLAFVVGVSVGIFSGFTGGWVDVVIMRIVDAMLSFPALVLAIAFAAALGPSLTNSMLAVALTLIPQFARLARGQALGVRSLLHVEAARSLGAGTGRLWKHILPLCLGPLLVQASLSLGRRHPADRQLGLSGPGRAAADPRVGRGRLRRGAVHPRIALGGALSGPDHPALGAGLQSDRRRAGGLDEPAHPQGVLGKIIQAAGSARPGKEPASWKLFQSR